MITYSQKPFTRRLGSEFVAYIKGPIPFLKHVVSLPCYPHMPIGRLWIYRLLFVCFVILCVLVPMRISSPRIKLAVSNFACVWFIGVLYRKSPYFGELCSQEAPPEAPNRSKSRPKNRRSSVEVGLERWVVDYLYARRSRRNVDIAISSFSSLIIFQSTCRVGTL